MAVNPDFPVSVNIQSMLILVVEHHLSVAENRYSQIRVSRIASDQAK